MYTANTMASVIETMGLSVPGSASHAAVDRGNRISREKRRDCVESAKALLLLLRRGIRARDIATREAFENGIVAMMALGGSTNGVLHLLALAHEAQVPLALDDFHEIGRKVPMLGNFKPFGKYVMADLDRIGGIPMVMKTLLDAGLLHGDCTTVTGNTVAENLANVSPRPGGQDVFASPDRPYAPPGRHISILRGNLAPEGAVLKRSGKDLARHAGPARVFDREEDALAAILGGTIRKGDVIVIRYEGPKGGPGMREMLSPSAALMGAGLGGKTSRWSPTGGFPAARTGSWSGTSPRRHRRGERSPSSVKATGSPSTRGNGRFPSTRATWRSRAVFPGGAPRSRNTREASWGNTPGSSAARREERSQVRKRPDGRTASPAGSPKDRTVEATRCRDSGAGRFRGIHRRGPLISPFAWTTR